MTKVNLNSLFWNREQVEGTLYHGNTSVRPLSGQPVASSLLNQKKRTRLSYTIMKAVANMPNIVGIGINRASSGSNHREYVLEIRSKTSARNYFIVVKPDDNEIYHTCAQSNRGRVCYHMVMAYLAIALYEFHPSNEFKEAFSKIDFATLDSTEQEAFEVVADAAYFILKDIFHFGDAEIRDELDAKAYHSVIEITDLTEEIFHRDSAWDLFTGEGGKEADKIEEKPDEISFVNGSQTRSLRWPKRNDLTPEEALFVPRGIEYIPVDTELEDIYWYITETREMGLPCNIWLKGHAATAKSTLVKYICQEMNLPLFTVAASRNLLEEQLLGVYTKVGDRWEWVDGLVPKAMRRGFALDFEEVSAMQDTVAAVLHNILDDSRFITLNDCPIEEQKYVKADPQMIVFATSNTGAGGGYTSAAKQMDMAFVSRWLSIQLEMPPVDVRVDILKRRTGFENEVLLRRMIEVQDSFNCMYDNRQLRQVCTIRDLINWALLCKHLDPIRAAKRAIVDQLAFSTEERQDIINALETFF